MYELEIYDKTGTEFKAYIRDYSGLKISYKINEISRLSFFIPAGELGSDKITLQKKNQVILKKQGNIFWKGIIQFVKPDNAKIEIECSDFLEVLRGKTIDGSYTGNLGTIINSVIVACNLQGDTYIDIVDAVTSKTGTFQFFDKDGYEAMREIVNNGLEMYVFSNTLVVRDSVGVNKNGEFLYDDTYPIRNTITGIDIEEDGKEIWTVVKGKGRGSLVSVKEDLDAKNKYGYRKKVITFDSANDQPTLDQMTQEYLDENKEEYISVKFQPIVKEIAQRDDYFIGDYINVSIKKSYNNILKVMRIVGINYNISNKSSIPGISFELSDNRKTSNTLFEDISDMRKKIIQLENK